MHKRSIMMTRIRMTVAGAVAAIAVLIPARGAAQTLADYDYVNLSFRGVAAAAGYHWSDRIRDTEHYTLRLDLGYLGPGIRIAPSITYWRSQLELAELNRLAEQISQQPGASVAGADLAPIRWSDVSLDVDAHFVWSVPFGLLTYLGAGVGLHALNGQGEAVDDTFVEDLLDDITVGVNGIAGVEFEPVPRLRIFGEGRYTAMTSLQYAAVRAGVQILFSRGNVDVGALPPPDPDTGRAP